jgi:hypothetical protein
MVAAVVVLALRGWLALQGCADGGDQLLPSPAELVDGSGVVGFEPLAGAGSAPYRAQIRSYNAWGASVPADEVDVEIDGESRPLLLDDLGYGGATIGAGGVHSVAVDGVEVDVHVFRNEWPGIGGSPAAVVAPIPEPVEIYGVTDGVVGRVANELWFAGDLTPAHRVLAADADLQGARAVQVDVDGRTDLVAWTTNQVFVLRGHPGGGLGWGVSFRAPGYTIASVDVGDVSGDNLPDLVFAWVTPEGAGVLDVWEASGLFEFEAAEPRNIPGKPVSVTAGDANGDGVGQATVLHEDGTWSRYLRGAEKQYIPVGPTLPPVLALPAGATLERCGDVNGDAADEITIAGPYDPAAQRSFWFMDVSLDALECAAGLTGVQCLTEYVQIEDLTGGEAACADADANGVDEMWLWDRLAGLRVYRHDLFSDLFLTSSIEHPFGTGVFDVSDRNGDRIGDPIVADDRVWSQWLGEPPSEATGIWSVRSELTVRVREDVISPFARAETDGDDGTLEWVTTLSNASGTYLRLVQYLPLGDGAALIGDIRLDDRGEIPTDVAVCGTDVYVAIGGEVVHASILDPPRPRRRRPRGGGHRPRRLRRRPGRGRGADGGRGRARRGPLAVAGGDQHRRRQLRRRRVRRPRGGSAGGGLRRGGLRGRCVGHRRRRRRRRRDFRRAHRRARRRAGGGDPRRRRGALGGRPRPGRPPRPRGLGRSPAAPDRRPLHRRGRRAPVVRQPRR